MGDCAILLSICIPTYNRADMAYECVMDCLGKIPAQGVEVVCRDNCSSDETWEKLKGIRDDRLCLYRNESNIGYQNTVRTMMDANGRFAMMLSDEDRIEVDSWDGVMEQLEDGAEDIAVFHCDCLKADGATAYHKPDHFFRKRQYETYTKIFYRCYYMSGIVFNASILKECVWENEGMFRQFDLYSLYPHRMAGICCVDEGGYAPLFEMRVRMSESNGKTFFDSDTARSRKGNMYWTLEGRLEQHLEWMRFFSLHFAYDAVLRKSLIEEMLLDWLRRFGKYRSMIFRGDALPMWDEAERRRELECTDGQWRGRLMAGYGALKEEMEGLIGKVSDEDARVLASALRSAEEPLGVQMGGTDER